MMMTGDRALWLMLGAVLAVGLTAGFPTSAAIETESVSGYAEWRQDSELIVDGQRVHANAQTKWTGGVSDLSSIPLGYEVRARGVRQADGSLLGIEIDVQPNGSELFESSVQQRTDALEGSWLQSGEAFDGDASGRRLVLGDVQRDGRHVERVRRLVGRLAPPSLDQSKLRVYVIDNKEWNAMAMGNGAIWVFRGIMEDMTDDELAVVVGHELAHYTHEHSRRQMKRAVWGHVGTLAVLLAASAIDSSGARIATELGARLGANAWMNGYGRDLEDQADRVGLRYAYEAGFNVAGAPAVWQRFLDKYGENDRVTTFFFSDHSQASARRKNLEIELSNNYARR
jgi:Zn-dependent protease with chaperone function